MRIGGDSADQSEGLDPTFAIIPYYCFYFLNRKDYGSSGFFLEFYSAFVTGENTTYTDGTYRYNTESTTAMAFGVGLGKKWITRKGASIELSLGLGRYVLGGDELGMHGREGVIIGKRF